MFKIICNIENLLKELFYNKKTLLVFYDESSQDSSKLIEILNSNDLDIIHNIILIDKTKYFVKNSHKLNKDYFNSFLQDNIFSNNLVKLLENLKFLYLSENNLYDTKIKNPKLFFIKNTIFPEVCYETIYCANYDTSNFLINIIKKYFNDIQETNNQMEIKKNVYINENLNIDEINKMKIFI